MPEKHRPGVNPSSVAPLACGLRADFQMILIVVLTELLATADNDGFKSATPFVISLVAVISTDLCLAQKVPVRLWIEMVIFVQFFHTLYEDR